MTQTFKIDRANLERVFEHGRKIPPARIGPPTTAWLSANAVTITDGRRTVHGDWAGEPTHAPIAVSHDRLGHIVKLLPDVPVTFEASKRTLIITADGGRWTTPLIDTASAPSVQIPAEWDAISGDALAEALEAVRHAQNLDSDWNYAMCGIHIEGLPGGARIAGASSARASIMDCHTAHIQWRHPAITIPTEAILSITKILSGGDGGWALGKGVLWVRNNAKRLAFMTELLEGEWPNLGQFVTGASSQCGVRFRVDTAALKSAIQRAETCVTKDAQWVELSFVSESEICVSASSEIGDARQSVAVQFYEGWPIKHRVNPRLLLDALAVQDDETDFSITGSPATAEDKRAICPIVLQPGAPETPLCFISPIYTGA